MRCHCSGWSFTILFLLPDAGLGSSSLLRTKPQGRECLGDSDPEGARCLSGLNDTSWDSRDRSQRDEPFFTQGEGTEQRVSGVWGGHWDLRMRFGKEARDLGTPSEGAW